MEKLLELLNEHRREKVNKQSGITEWHYNAFTFSLDNISGQQAELLIISKQYGFIKWLVENEKIDSGTRNPLFITELVGEQEKQIPYSFYEEMLIRLALSENPIEDLISYLDLSKS